eukprot:6187892-Pleurochrysis_carterae.AAC.1
MFGLTMVCEWGLPVATLSKDKGGNTSPRCRITPICELPLICGSKKHACNADREVQHAFARELSNGRAYRQAGACASAGSRFTHQFFTAVCKTYGINSFDCKLAQHRQYVNKRNKHNCEGTRRCQKCDVYAALHFAKLQHASLLSETPCTLARLHAKKQCMQSALMPTTLRNCSAAVLGEAFLDGKSPSINPQSLGLLGTSCFQSCSAAAS